MELQKSHEEEKKLLREEIKSSKKWEGGFTKIVNDLIEEMSEYRSRLVILEKEAMVVGEEKNTEGKPDCNWEEKASGSWETGNWDSWGWKSPRRRARYTWTDLREGIFHRGQIIKVPQEEGTEHGFMTFQLWADMLSEEACRTLTCPSGNRCRYFAENRCRFCHDPTGRSFPRTTLLTPELARVMDRECKKAAKSVD